MSTINQFPDFDNFLNFENKIAELTSELKNLTDLNVKLSSEILVVKKTNLVLVDENLQLNNKYSNLRIVLVSSTILCAFLLICYYNSKSNLQSREDDNAKKQIA